MAGRIPPEFIDSLLTRIDIVDVIGRRVPLKKSGASYKACCPFHDEKTPSFHVSRDKQLYHCFGCDAGGSAIGFLMAYEHLGFVEAVEELAGLAGMPMPERLGADAGPDLGELYRLLNRVSSYYQQQLRQHPQAARAIDYLKGRGLSGEIAARFGIGFAPPGWDNLMRCFASEPQRLEQLAQTGMIADRDGRHYDRFRDRIMFPIRDRRGRTIGFGGRQLADAGPKYLNSPETPLFHKGRELYGLFEARTANRQLDSLVVVEGYMDVIALAQFGIHNAVATLGTATTDAHLERLFRGSAQIVFCFDGDRAGRAAAWKALTTTLPHMRDGREARFLFLPETEDPDTLIRTQGQTGFQQRLDTALPLSRFLFDSLADKVDLETPDGRARLAELARPHLARLPRGVFQELMLKQLAALTGLDTRYLQPQIVSKPAEQYPAPRRGPDKSHISPVRMAIALLLQHPNLASNLPLAQPDWQQLEIPGVALLTQLLELLRNQPNLTQGAIIEHWRDKPECQHLLRLAHMPLPIPEQGVENELSDALQRLTERYRRQETQKLLDKTRHQTLTAEEKQQLKNLLGGTHTEKAAER